MPPSEAGPSFVMAGLVPAIPAVKTERSIDRDGRDEPGHDSGLLPASRSMPVTAMLYGGEQATRNLSVPVEIPVEIAFGGVPFAVMMLTPRDLTDFAYGFSLTEGLIRSADDVRAVDVATEADSVRLDVTLAPDRMSGHLARRRAMTGRTGCGVCGIEDLASLQRGGDWPVTVPAVALSAIGRAVAELEAGQALNQETHSVHAAGWANRDGRVLHLREDVGRHNALDKLVGLMLRERIAPEDGFLVITSRCSFEMVDKAAAIGAGLLVAVSGPTSLALDRATRLGMALLGIARHDAVTVFSGDPFVGGLARTGERNAA